MLINLFLREIFTRKSSEDHQAKRRKRKKLKPEEQEGMPQHQHCPPAKRRGDRNPEYHEEQRKDVALIFAAHTPKNAEKELT
jgi:hypothetical protein